MSRPWPVVIIRTRYQGVYEGGRRAVYPARQVPEDALADDMACQAFFGDPDLVCGTGGTPDQAYEALRGLLDADP